MPISYNRSPANLPGWQNVVVHNRFLPEMTVNHWLVTPEKGGVDGRPPVQIPGRSRNFQAGDWVGSAGWLADEALASARQAARLVSQLGPQPNVQKQTEFVIN